MQPQTIRGHVSTITKEGKSTHQVLQDSWFKHGDHIKNDDVDGDHCEKCSTSPSSIDQDSMVSNGSSSISSSWDTTDDASSSFSSNSNGALYDLSEIMAQLPIKRGLSKFYQGKSESFASLSRVTSIEDLAKKAVVTPFRKKLKSSKSCGTGLNSYKPSILPKAIISKKATKSSLSLSPCPTKRGSFMKSRPPMTPLPNLEC